jgi:methyl-accepting chemotaxis protein
MKPIWIFRLARPLLNLRIGLRLTIAFTGVFVLMAAMAVFATLRMADMQQRMAHITEGNNQQIASVNAMIDSVSQRAITLRNLALLADPDLRKEEFQTLDESAKVYKKAEADLLVLIERFNASEAEKALIEAIQRADKVTSELMAHAAELAMAGQTAEAVTFLMEKIRPRQARWITVLQTMSGLQAKTSSEFTADSAAAYERARQLLWGFVGLALTTGVLLAWGVTVSITHPIQEAVRVARVAATGDLSSRVHTTRLDETGDLLSALGAMNENLTRVVADVRQGSENIANGSTEIAMGNSDLSHRTEQQASSLQETAASMEQIRSTVHTNSQTAHQASTMAEGASAMAARGGSVVGDVVKTMQEISTASRRIADIIGVIDSIAFQTNILALNAAVEAARAGEQGRGFAVVASEVRSLAQRSAAAAREIKGLIGASTESVQRGSRLADDAGTAMTDIVTQVRRVAELIGEISTATNEQTSGINQIGDAISNLDRSTQQNAALVEESAAAAESLKQQSVRLLSSVSVFKLSPRPA